MKKIIFDLKKERFAKMEKEGGLTVTVRELVPVASGTGFLSQDTVFFAKHFTKGAAIKTFIESVAFNDCKPVDEAKTEFTLEYPRVFNGAEKPICINYRLWFKIIED